jgi:hypothetical protein
VTDWRDEDIEMVDLEDEEEDQDLDDRLAFSHADHTRRLLVTDIIRVARRPLRPVDVLEMLSCLDHLEVLKL